jgi:pyruvate/2-oxoglutarate dehydrogenase complex dihydrolipoamide dehydrogenase (E3) component
MSDRDKSENYEVIVIGAGQGGGPFAAKMAAAGRKTAIIERKHVGGTCVNYGCTPTKTMIASGRVAYFVRRASDYGVNTGPVSVDMTRVRERKRDVVESFRSGSEKSLTAKENLELIRGHARFTAAKELSVILNDGGTRTMTADIIVINTGTRPGVPPIDGIGNIPTLNNETVMELDEVPEHLLIIGGGYIGSEFGQLFRRLGARVTIIQLEDRLLSKEDPDVCDEVAGIFRDDGIELILSGKTTKAEQIDGRIRLTVETPDGSRTVSGFHLLIAAGRQPNSDDLGADKAGLSLDERGYIIADDKLATNIDGVYAMGDIKGGPAFTHISYDDSRILWANLRENANRSTRDRLVPYTLFIDPQLGRVGATEKQLKEAGRKYRVAKLPMSSVARAIETDETRGFMKALVDPDTKQILGAAMLGIQGGELMNMIQIAMMGKLPYTALRDSAFAHPTLGESLNNLFATIDE